MDPEAIERWHRNRLDDEALTYHGLVPALEALGIENPKAIERFVCRLREFAEFLQEENENDSLRAFLARLEGSQTRDAKKQLSQYVKNKLSKDKDRERKEGYFREGLNVLCGIPTEVRDTAWADPNSPSSALPDGMLGNRRLRKSLPRHELDRIEAVENKNATYPSLLRFSSTLLLRGHGGLSGWLGMYHDGNEEQARQLLSDNFAPERKRDVMAVSHLQTNADIKSEQRIRVQGTGTKAYVGNIGQAAALYSGTEHAAARGPALRLPPLIRDEAVTWYANRKDDHYLIAAVYLAELRPVVPDAKRLVEKARLLRYFGEFLGKENPRDTLRTFLPLYESGDRDALDKVARFRVPSEPDNSRYNKSFNAALEELLRLGAEKRHPGANDVVPPLGDFLRKMMLPPADREVITQAEKALKLEERKGSLDPLLHALASFGAGLLDMKIGGLHEWLSMQLARQDGTKTLFEAFLKTSNGKTAKKRGLSKAVGVVQRLYGVDAQYWVSSAKEFSIRPQRGEHKQEAVGALSTVIDFDKVPRRARTAQRAAQPETGLGASTSAPPVKLEPMSVASRSSPRAPTYVEIDLDQARTAFYRELGQLCDLTGGQAEWRAHWDSTDKVIVHHRMKPVEENDHKFPLRDPDPLKPGRAHPRYTGPNGECHPNVSLTKLQLGSGFFRYLERMAKSGGRLSIDSPLRDVIGRLEADAAAELQRLIRGPIPGQPAMRRAYTRLLADKDVLPHERMLIGQYGLFVPRPKHPAQRPTLSNGRILGFYMGALIENAHELDQTQAMHPDFALYAIDAHPKGNRLATYSGMGGTNSIAFANTALKADVPEPAYDHERLNATFIQLDAWLTDKTGHPRPERIIAMVALDNLFDGDKPEVQVLVDYGDEFLEHFRRPQTTAHVKSEPEGG